MFSVLDKGFRVTKRRTIKKLQRLNYIGVNDDTEARANFTQASVKVENIVGNRFRSRKGCAQCKKRKKKCDENRPVCGACKMREEECSWNLILSSEKPKSPVYDIRGLEEEDLYYSTADHEQQENVDLPCILDRSEMSSELISNDTGKSHNHDLGTIFSIPSVSSIGNSLNEMDSLLMYFFQNEVSKILCIGPTSSNYLLKTFMPVAFQDESVFHAITSWARSFLNVPGHENKDCSLSINKAYCSLSKKLSKKSKANTGDIFLILCFNMALIGYYVCSGDTKMWRKCFTNCKNLIDSCGGFKNLYFYFRHSHEMTFLLYNFQYHDIMSSHSNFHGTSFKVNEYQILLEHSDSDYGIDPFQGIIHPLYLILAEIINAKVELKNEDALLNEKWISFENGEIEETEYFTLKDEYIEFAASIAEHINSRIESCRLSDEKLEIAGETEGIRLLNIEIFQIYKDICKINLHLYIKKNPPCSLDVQIILRRLLRSIENMINTSMIVVLCYPLLIAGVVCCKPAERRTISKLFDIVQKKSPVNNIRLAWVIVRENWKSNADGMFCADWAELCEKHGWDLCVT